MSTPFLKWAGGKGAILHKIRPLMPEKFNAYHEPFLGGGAMFFSLRRDNQIGAAYLSDACAPLIATYMAIKFHHHLVSEELDKLKKDLSEKGYYAVRDMFNKQMAQGEILDCRMTKEADLDPAYAAMFIYLNKCCFNGLYRTNKGGAFNVPWGRKGREKPPSFPTFDELYNVSDALQGVIIKHADAEKRIRESEPLPGDLVYFDPPYYTEKDEFTHYTPRGFDLTDHMCLAQTAEKLKNKGVHVVVSNSDTPTVRALYSRFKIHEIQAPRRIARDPTRRGDVGELVIT